MKQMCVDWLAERSDFLHESDNEPLDQEDAYIQSVADPMVQHELRWQKYLRRLSEGAWDDRIALSAICHLFNVKLTAFRAHPGGADVLTFHEFW